LEAEAARLSLRAEAAEAAVLAARREADARVATLAKQIQRQQTQLHEAKVYIHLYPSFYLSICIYGVNRYRYRYIDIDIDRYRYIYIYIDI